LNYFTTTTVSDKSGFQSTSANFFTTSQTATPGPPLWFNNYTNPLCLPMPALTALSSGGCATINTTFTFYVEVRDWNQDVVSSYQGGNITVSFNATSGLSWVGMTLTGSNAIAPFVNGVATFTVMATRVQNVQFTVIDSLPVIASGPVSTMVVPFTTSRRFGFAPLTVAAIGQGLNVTVMLLACGGGLITGQTTSVTVVASGAVSGGGVVTINSATGLGSLVLTAYSSTISTLSLSDSASTGFDVTSTTRAMWGGAAATYTVYLSPGVYNPTSSIPVSSSYTLYVSVRMRLEHRLPI
jgi:hypothetical protein